MWLTVEERRDVERAITAHCADEVERGDGQALIVCLAILAFGLAIWAAFWQLSQ